MAIKGELHLDIFLSGKSSMATRVIELGMLAELTLKGSLASPTSTSQICTRNLKNLDPLKTKG
jgi:hypothetical protein